MTKKNHSSIILMFLMLIVTLLILVGVSKNILRPGTVEGEWGWEYRPVPLGPKTIAPITIFALLVVYLFALLRSRLYLKNKLYEIFCLTFLGLLGYLLIISMASLMKIGLDEVPLITINEIHTSYFLDAAKVGSMTEFLGTFHLRMPTLLCHSKTHPPGPIVFYWLILSLLRIAPAVSSFILKLGSGLHLNLEYIANSLRTSGINPTHEVLSSAIASGFVLPLIASMTIFPIYFFGKRLYGPELALTSSVIFLVIPSMTQFSPQMDQLFSLFAVSTVAAFYYALEDRDWRYSAASGFLMFLGLFFSLGILALLPIMLCLYVRAYLAEKATGWYGREERRTRFVVQNGLVFILGFSIPYVLSLLVFEFSLLRVFAAILADQRRFNVTQHRTYSTWLVYNLYDFFVFLGVPVSMLLAKRIYNFLKNVQHEIQKQTNLFLVALIASLAILDFSGVTRGEVARMWIFLMPLVVLAGAPGLQSAGDGEKSLNTRLLLVTLLMQFFSIIVFKTNLSVFINF